MTFCLICDKVIYINMTICEEVFMSAIWGAINLKENEVTQKTKTFFKTAFDKCRIDRYEEITDKNVYMGCGIQYITPESVNEELPYKSDGIYCTADVILDNREKLCEMAGITKSEENKMPDGKILFEVYKNKGKKCLNDLLGAYTFVWYDSNKNIIEVVLDAVGNRCLYYTFVDETFCFASLMEPLVELKKQELCLNDRWFADFVGTDTPAMYNDLETTPFEDIYRIAPAGHIVINKDCLVKKDTYWNPYKRKDFGCNSDEEYKKVFLQIWNRAVKDTIRVNKASILLSGGYDSTAVAAVAAPYLKEKGEKLYSYTSIPVRDFELDKSGRKRQNESEDVKKTAQFYGNIETNFISLEDVDIWKISNEMMRVFETPYKPILNALWIYDAMKQAYKNGSRVILTGEFGNSTISFSGMKDYANYLYKKKDYKKLDHELKALAPDKEFSISIAKSIIKKECESDYDEPLNVHEGSYVRRKVAKETGATKELEKLYKEWWEADSDWEKALDSNIEWRAMRQIGEIQMKMSLYSGVIVRDPTRDKRIMEFCISIPISQYCKDGADRRLVREYMKDIVPSHIINARGKGEQSADIQCRLKKKWAETRKEWMELYEKNVNNKYVAALYAKQQLEDNESIDKLQQFDLTRHFYTVCILEFIDYLKEHGYIEKNSAELEQYIENDSVSVIVYADKNEEKLEKCLDSIISQNIIKMEVFLMNNGRSDNIDSLCRKYADKDNRIKIVHGEFSSSVQAWQEGINIASNNCISLLNGNEVLANDAYTRLLKLSNEQAETDFVLCCGKTDKEDKQKVFALFDRNITGTYIDGIHGKKISADINQYFFRRDFLIKVPLSKNLKKYQLTVMDKANTAIFVEDEYIHRDENGNKKSNGTVEEWIEENQEKIRIAKEYLSKDTYHNCEIYFYSALCKLMKQKKNVNQELIRQAWDKEKIVVRDIIKNTYVCGKKKKIKIWLSTFIIN